MHRMCCGSVGRVGTAWACSPRRPECLSTEVPQDQWDIVMRSISITGEMLSLDPMTATMDTQIDVGVIVRRPYATPLNGKPLPFKTWF